ncbi:MAG TPA: PAS domain-containing protein [Thermodesulfovibrionales bacterium]|nr:PAS domain-containing protein [Thermodesulfovibrionales bacterium]
MNDEDKTKDELIKELVLLRRQLGGFRAFEIERKLAEEALSESEEKFRSLVESTDDSIYLVDRNYRYLYMNRKHMSRMGFGGEEYIGRMYGDFHTDEETRNFVEEIRRVFETAEPAQHEHRSKRDDKYFLRTLSPVKGPEGKTIAVSVVSKNITTLKLMEEERERLIAELQEALANIKTLKGLIPICAWCKKVRDDKGYWDEIETYVRRHSEADFTHGICATCLEELEAKENRKDKEKE